MSWQTTASIRLLVIISLIATILVLLASGVSATQGPEGDATTDHRVVSGETLWEIADEYTPVEGSVRRTVEAIKTLNGLQGGLIHAGDTLEVPLPAAG